jgi:phosphoglycolate phosphatase
LPPETTLTGEAPGASSPIAAVVFDFDLTLADSSVAAADCANYALRALGLPAAEPAVVRRTIGLSLRESFGLLSGSDDPGLAATYARRFVERADQVMADLVCLYPGTMPTVVELRRRGLRTAIVSTKFRYRIETILGRAGLGEAVDVIVGGEDVSHHKPDPEGLHQALRKLDVPAANALYVGDHPVDAQAAAAARIAFVAVLTGVTDARAWAPFAPRRIIESIAQLPRILTDVRPVVLR